MAGKTFPLYDRALEYVVGVIAFVELPSGQGGAGVYFAKDGIATAGGYITRETAEELNLCGWQGMRVEDKPASPPLQIQSEPTSSADPTIRARSYEKVE